MTDYLTSRRQETDFRIRTPQTPKSGPYFMPWDDDLPLIDSTESFNEAVTKLVGYLSRLIDTAYTYQQLRTTFEGQSLKPLIQRLSDDCHHPGLVAALLAAKYIVEATNDEGTGLSESRGLACEIVAWQFLTYLSERELIDYLLYEVPGPSIKPPQRKLSTIFGAQRLDSGSGSGEATPLLNPPPPTEPRDNHQGSSLSPRLASSVPSIGLVGTPDVDDADADGAPRNAANEDMLNSFVGMNALEVAGSTSAKRFLSQRPVQKIINGIWSGKVIFWESLSVNAVRRPRTYNKRIADPFVRLRVPKYQKAFQVGFFVSFLVLFYAVLVGPVTTHITPVEVLLYWWMAAFAYDEFGEIQDTGILFYRVDFWSLWDIAIIGVSIAFVVMRIYGIAKQDDYVTGMAFDVLSMVALFLVPRIFSVMSLNPYFGSLIPVLKEMTKAFCMFLPVILVLYLGFLTTFTMLARERMTFREVSWTLVEVFFGSSYLGFDTSLKISPHFGFPLMLIFVCLTNIVLITSLISLVSNSLSEVMAHARTEYLFQYSIYVLESSSSRRMTYFMPPLNLIPLLLLRPLRLFVPSDNLRRVRILVLKATHVGFIAIIWTYESMTRVVTRGSSSSTGITRDSQLTPRPLSASFQTQQRERYAQRPCRSAPQTALTNATPMEAPRENASDFAGPEVVKLLEKLSAQVDELSAMIMEQQQG